MPLMSYLEQVGFEKGEEKGLEKGEQRGLHKAIELGLELKYGEEGLALMPQVMKIENLSALSAVCDAIKPATSLPSLARDDTPSSASRESDGLGPHSRKVTTPSSSAFFKPAAKRTDWRTWSTQ